MELRRRQFLHLAAGCLLATARGALAQAQADTIFGVTALDVAPDSAAQGVALLKQYREAARKQPGNLGVDLLQEDGRPNRFVIYEAWRDQAAYDANEKASALAELGDKLKPLSDGPYDRRDYQVVSVGQAKAVTAPGAVCMQVHLDVFPPGLAATLVAVKEVADAARKGEGNLRYDVVQSINQPKSHMTLYGVWQSRKAFNDFEGSGYARRFRDTVGPLLGSPFDDRLYAYID